MIRILFVKLIILFSAFSISKTAFAQRPSNDSCQKARIFKIGNNGFGIGTYQSDSINIDSGTVQLGEFFHNSLITAGNDKRSIWFKFYLPTRRGISLELKQNANKIAIKDCGFTTYFSNTCLPGSTAATAAKLTTLNQFGSSFHPCMDAGWYMVQVSAKTRAAGKIYLEITTSFPYEHSAITNAEYDARDSAYYFGNDVVGVKGLNYKYIDFELGCYTIKDSTELFKPTGKNYAAYNQSAWFVFQANNNSDFTQMAFSSPWTCLGASDTVAYRLYKGDCRGSGSLQLLDSNFNDFSANSTCYSNCYDVVKQYKCFFDSGQYYSFQLIFQKDNDKKIRLYLGNTNTHYDSGYYQPKTGIAKNFGVVSGTYAKNIGFSCGSYINNYSCSNAMPAGGIKLNNWRYNMNQWVTFTLTEQTRLGINFTYNTTLGNYQFYDQLGFRLFKDTITNNCNDIDTSHIIFKGIGNVNNVIDCLEPGQYVIQLLGTDTIARYSGWACNGSFHLGKNFTLHLDAVRLPKRSLFSLYNKGQADSINAINNKIETMPKWQYVYAKADTIACNNTLKPENSCDTFLTKAIYRVFKIGDVTGDGKADSGMLEINSLIYGYASRGNHRLYKGNALTLRDNQTKTSYPDILTGLKPYITCFKNSYTDVCVEPGEYTLVSFFDNYSLGLTEKPSFYFYHARSRFDTYAKAEFIDSFHTYKTYYSKPDTFTCINNPDTIDGVSCGLKNSYHVFYLDSIAITSIASSNYYSNTLFSLFKGDIRKGKSGLKLYEDNSGKWKCLNSAYWGKMTTQCEPLFPGWYTIVGSRDGADYDSARRMDFYGYTLYTNAKNFFITTSKPTVTFPKYNRPYKAAFVDSLINNNKPLSYDTNYSTKAMPQHLAEFRFPIENYQCGLDTPLTHFPKSALCDNNTSDVAYYVFTLKKNSYVRIINQVSWGAKIKMYDFDVRKDSAKLATATPIQNCNYNPAYLDFCNLKPGKYTLVYFIKRPKDVAASITPTLYIDSVVSSRFDHANKAYDFGTVPGDGQWHTGKKGDIHPIDASLPASHDIIGCKTGAQLSDPFYNACYADYNPNVYLKDTNAIMYPYDSAAVRYKGSDLYYNANGYGPQRNLWYSFVVKGKGTVGVSLTGKDQKYLYSSGVNYKFSIYESDEDGSLSLDSLKKSGKLDSTKASGLKFIANDSPYPCYYGSDLIEYFSIPACESIKPRRYYLVMDLNNYNPLISAINLHVSVNIKYDSISLPETKYDYYSKANNINGFNTQNLLINGNAEQNNTIGWNGSSGFIQYTTPAPKEGSYCFWTYAQGSNAELSQIVDISHYASYIDAGKAKTSFSGFVQSASQTNPDETQLVLEYLNASGNVISSYQSGFKANVGSWLKEAHGNTTPANTRKIRVKLQSKDIDANTYHYTYFDNLILLQEVDTVKTTSPLKSGIVYQGNTDYFSGATLDDADVNKYYSGCSVNNGTIWYKFKVDSTGYLNYNFIYSYLSGSTLLTTNGYSQANIRLFKNITPGDSLSGLVYQPGINVNYTKLGYSIYTCVSPGWYYLQINKCDLIQCSDYAYPQLFFDFHRGDFCKTAMPMSIDTLEAVTEKTLVNCHTIGTDFGEDGSNMGCLYGPKGYKSSWFVVDYTDTTKVDLEFRLAESTDAKPSEIRYRTYYGNCQSLTPAPCNNNALTSFTIDCIKKGTYYVQVVTPENATGELQMTVEAKKNVDTTCNPIDIFQPNAAFYYNTSCPENVVEFINTSSRGDSIRYLWDFGYSGKKDTALNPYFAYPPLKQEKNYTVKLIITNIARGSKDSLDIVINVPFAPFIDISNNDTALCIGDSVTLKGTISHGKGIWSTGDTSKTITVKKTDWYYYRMQESPKLLINGNAEQYPISNGWTAASGTWDRTAAYINAQDSSYFFLGASNYTAGTYEMYQEVNISKDSVLIDAGLAKTSMISHVQSYPEATLDESRVILEYYDAKNNLLAIYQSEYNTNVGSWLKLTHSRTTPPKTRKLKVRLQAINSASGTATLAFFDNIILKMRSACDYADSVYVQVNPLPEVKLGKDTTFCWHDSVLLKPKTDYNNPYWVYEPMNTATLSGKLISSATYDVSGKNVLLTPATAYRYGNIEWEPTSLKLTDTFEIGFEFWTGNYGNCKYGYNNLYLFNASSPSTFSQNAGGYSITLNEYDNQIQINWEGGRIRTTNCPIILNNETWHKVKVLYSNQRFLIYMDGILADNFLDATTRTQTGYKTGISGSNNYYGCAVEHRIKKFYLTKTNPALIVVPSASGRKFNYVWNDSKNDSMRYEKGTKNFTVKVTDQNKCVSKPDAIKVISIKTYDSLFIKKEQICSELDTFRLIPLVKGGLFYGHKAVDTIGLIKVDSAKFGSNSVFYTVKDTLGCNYIDTGFFIVDSVPNIKITPVNAVCRSANSFKLTVNNTDGFFYGGTYVDSSGNFDPKLTTKKSNKVYYRTRPANCIGRDSIVVTVDSLPNAAITAAGPFCKNGGTKTISPKVNSGGKFSGNFIDSTGKFNPLTANKGNNKIYYTFKDGNNCSNRDSILIKVDTIPNAAITTAGPFCKNAGIKTITAKVNSGGKFSGNFIDSVGKFNPLTANKGNNKIYYTFKDGNNCSNKDSILIRVDTIPNAAITASGPFCKNGGLKTITAKFNTGGTFSGGSFINTSGSFNPANAAKGNNKIYYTFTDGNSCSNKDSILIRVDSIPNAAITAAGPFCKNGGIKTITPKVNSGGKFSGNFIDSTGKFNPLTANKGNNKIYYTFKDGNNCSNKDSILIKVDTIPNAAINTAGPFCKNAGIKTVSAKVNSGGKFSGGTYIDTVGKFNPGIANKGNNKIYYTFKDGNSCSNKDSIIIRVDTIPNAVINAAGPFCKNGGLKTITAKFNTGGTYSGGSFINTSGSFNPVNAAKGNNKIYYTFTDGNSCSNKDSILIRVDTIPNAAINAAGPFCKNGGIKTITPKVNSGGKFSGNFIDSVGKFNPLNANKGSNKIYYTFKDGNNCSNKDSILIKVDTIPNAAINAAGPFCKNAGIKTITAKVNSGGKFSGGTYIDTVGKFNPLIANKGNNKIYYTFKDGNNCSNKDSILIRVDTIPNASINAAGPFCQNGGLKTITAKFNTGGTFSGGSFINSSGSFNPTNAAKGNNKIYYTFTDGNSCSNKDSISIKVDTIPNASITAAGPFCKNGGINTITPKVNSGGKFSGSFIDSTGKFNPLTANKGNNKIYYTFKDGNNCSNKDSILIKVDTIPNAAITAAGPFCKNAGIKTLVPKVNSGGTFSGGIFIDNAGNFDPSKAVIGNNKVYYSFTDGNTCSNKDSILIRVDSIPKVGLNSAGPFCNLDNPFDLLAKNTNLTFVYSGGAFVNSTGKFFPNQAVIGTNKVYTTGTDKNGCNSKDSIDVVVFKIPDASLKPVAEICEDSSSVQIIPTITGGTFSGGTFVSNTGIFFPPIAKAGVHKVYYDRSTNGCFAKDSVLVTVRAVPVPNVSVSPLIGCEPLEVILKSKGGYACEWKSNGTIVNTTDSFTQILMQGIYAIDLKLTTQYGCKALVKNLITVHPKPTAGFTYVPDEIFARITTVDFLNKSLGSITGYEWFVDGIIFNTNKDATSQFTDTGNFDIRLIVSNSQGCRDTADARLFVIDEFRVFMPNTLTPNGDGLNDSFFPAGIGIDKVQLQIYNRWGEKLHDSNTPWDCTYKGKLVQDGSYLYFLHIKDAQGFNHFFKGSVTVLK